MTTETEHPNPNKWWFHRRLGYYTGKWWAILQTPCWVALELHSDGSVAALATVIGWSYGICATLIISYFGNNIVESWAGKVKQ